MATGNQEVLNLTPHSIAGLHGSQLAAVIQKIEKAADSRLDDTTILIPVSELTATVAAIDGRHSRLMGESDATRAAQALIGMYPARSVNNAEVFSNALSKVVQAYEIEFVKRVLDPVEGLPSRLKYLPTLAEVKEALEMEKGRRGTIRAVAKWMLDEHARRRAEREEAERWKLSPEELERRRIRAEELTRPFKSERTDTNG